MVLTVLLGQLFGLAVALVLVGAFGESFPGLAPLGWAVLSGLAGVGGLGAFYLALARGTMGLVAPLVGLIAAVLPAAVGIATGDPVDPAFLLGMGLALAAIVVIAWPQPELDALDAAVEGVQPAPSRWRELLLMLVAGLGFAGFTILINASHDAGAGVWWPIFVVRITGLTTILVTIAVLVLRGRPPLLRARPSVLATGFVAGAGDVGGNVFFLLAVAATTLSVAAVLSSLYPVVTTLLARVVLGERLGPVRAMGVGLAIGAMLLISFGTTSG